MLRPAIVFGAAIVFILVYNLYQLPIYGTLYLAVDSDFWVGLGKHHTIGGLDRPYISFTSTDEDVRETALSSIHRVFNLHSNRYN